MESSRVSEEQPLYALAAERALAVVPARAVVQNAPTL
jgi:hypothetical protein